jgi:hypothetical protein
MNLSMIIKQFFIENDFHKIANKTAVVRNDGIVLFSNSDNFNESSSIGALVSGLWQAAQSLNSIVSDRSEILEFRLSFDTSDQGIYILPFNINKKEFYICAIYNDVNNPALLKRHLRNLKANLSNYLLEYVSQNEDIKQDFLFNNITDEEMDNLFSFSRY